MSNKLVTPNPSRRSVLTGMAASGALLATGLAPRFAQAQSSAPIKLGFQLHLEHASGNLRLEAFLHQAPAFGNLVRLQHNILNPDHRLGVQGSGKNESPQRQGGKNDRQDLPSYHDR